MPGDHHDDPASQVLEIERLVLSYLLEHPDAKDTVEGILEWWLPDASRGLRKVDLTLALDQLLEREWITSSRFTGTTVYGLERGRRDEILRWLEH